MAVSLLPETVALKLTCRVDELATQLRPSGSNPPLRSLSSTDTVICTVRLTAGPLEHAHVRALPRMDDRGHTHRKSTEGNAPARP